MDLLTWFALFLVLVCTLYWYLRGVYSYWERLGIPSAPAIPLLGTEMVLITRPIQVVDVERQNKYGRVYGGFEGRNPVLNVADPELLKNIFVKDFPYFVNRRAMTIGDPIADNMVSILQGEEWKRIRNLMTPAFSTGKIKKMMSIIIDSSKTLCQNFEAAAKTGEPVDAKGLFGAFTMDVIASTAFATKVDSHNDPNNKFVSMAKKVFSQGVPYWFILFVLFPALTKLFGTSFITPEARDFFGQAIHQIIEERKRTGQYRNDFLQLLLEAAGELKPSTVNKKEDQNEENGTESKISTSQKGMTETQVVSQCFIFFIAGYETTASTLAFASYHLALNPDCQERLIQEVDETLSNNKGNITYEGIQSMKYLDSVICETLRMYPPLVRIERTATDDYDLGYADLKIPKGMVIVVPVYALHRDPEFYPDPEKFDPERFSPEAKEARDPYTYFPFGAGPRNCIGMRFALMEIKICFAQFFSQFRVKRCPETKVPLEFIPSQGFLQTTGITLRVEERTDKKFERN